MDYARELAPFALMRPDGIFTYDSAGSPVSPADSHSPGADSHSPGVDSHSPGADSHSAGADSHSPGAGRLPLVLIHGLGDEADTWRNIFPDLARSRRVVALDLPGFGRTPCTGPSTMKKHVAAIRAVLESTSPAILAGNSMGAAAGQLTALRHPDLVRGLAFLDGGLPSGSAMSGKLLLTLLPGVGERAYRAWRKKPGQAYGSLTPYYADLASMAETDRAFLARRVVERIMSDSQCRAYCSSFRSFLFMAAGARGALLRDFSRTTLPLLLIWGEQDKILPPDTRRLLLEARPDCIDLLIPGAGHLPHQENPEAVIDALSSFIEKIDSGAPGL